MIVAEVVVTKEFVGLHRLISRSEQFQSIPSVSKQNTNCSERKLKLPARVRETFPDISDKNASDAKVQLVVPQLQRRCPSACIFLSLSVPFHQKQPSKPRSAVALNVVFMLFTPTVTATSTVIAPLLKWTFYM